MIDIGLTNALAQIRDALYEISDTLKEVKETETQRNGGKNHESQQFIPNDKREKA